MAELLLADGADPNVKDKNGHTPLDLAVASGQAETTDLLKAELKRKP